MFERALCERTFCDIYARLFSLLRFLYGFVLLGCFRAAPCVDALPGAWRADLAPCRRPPG